MLELEVLKQEQATCKQQIDAVNEAIHSFQEQIKAVSAEVEKNKVSLVNGTFIC